MPAVIAACRRRLSFGLACAAICSLVFLPSSAQQLAAIGPFADAASAVATRSPSLPGIADKAPAPGASRANPRDGAASAEQDRWQKQAADDPRVMLFLMLREFGPLPYLQR
jgi:hypothetical protein